MSNGEITPCVVKEFETLCENFLQGGRTILEDERVPSLFGSFENPIVLDWLSSEHACLAALPFAEFMSEFR